jgi:hypothetical protein
MDPATGFHWNFQYISRWIAGHTLLREKPMPKHE